MKRLVAMILLVAVMVTGITVPEKKASAEEYQAGVPYTNGETDDRHYYEEDYTGTIVYEEDENGNPIFDNRVFDAKIEYKDGAIYEKKIAVGFIEKFVCNFEYKFYSDSKYTKSKLSEITWSSSDTSIATVSGTGKTAEVTGKKAGKATITAQLGINGQKITKDITIVKNQTAVNTITGSPTSGNPYKRTDFISYDSKGNLVWTIKIKNCFKKRYLYVLGTQECDFGSDTLATKNNNIKWGYDKKYKIYGFKSDLSFDLKPGKSKTIKITMKKSKLKKKYQNMNLTKKSIGFDGCIVSYSWNDVKKAKKTGHDVGSYSDIVPAVY